MASLAWFAIGFGAAWIIWIVAVIVFINKANDFKPFK